MQPHVSYAIESNRELRQFIARAEACCRRADPPSFWRMREAFDDILHRPIWQDVYLAAIERALDRPTFDGGRDWHVSGLALYESDEWLLSLRFLEETDLPHGKVMYYRKQLDVHAQIPPPADSASLNLMLDDAGDLDRNQFYFDVASGRIIGRVENTVAKRPALLDFGHGLADERSLSVLHRIARETACEATRRKVRELAESLGEKRD